MNEIRIASPEDFPLMAKIEQRSFTQPWSENAVAEFAENGGLLLVSGEKGAVRGHLLASFVLDEGTVAEIAVDPDARRKGIASALFEALEKEAVKRNVKALFLEVRASNAAAIALYEKRGFARVGTRKNFYRDIKEDAFIYRKDLV